MSRALLSGPLTFDMSVNLARATLSPESLLVTNSTKSQLGWGFPSS